MAQQIATAVPFFIEPLKMKRQAEHMEASSNEELFEEVQAGLVTKNVPRTMKAYRQLPFNYRDAYVRAVHFFDILIYTFLIWLFTERINVFSGS